MINITTRIGTLFGGLINATSAFVAGLIGSLNFTPGSSATGSITATNPATESFTFTRASTGTFVGSNGLLQTAASGVSRIDYLGKTAGHILLEPASTNLVLVGLIIVTKGLIYVKRVKKEVKLMQSLTVLKYTPFQKNL